MNYKLQPWEHQLQAIDKAKVIPNLALFFEQGCGKTATMIHILRWHYSQIGKFRKTLIVGPVVVLNNWAREFGMHSAIKEHEVMVLDARGRKKNSWDFWPDIIITNYEAFQSKDFISQIEQWGPDIMVLDESHRVKNPSSKRAKAIIKVADQCQQKYILTGTPILNSPMDIFNQFRVLDKGDTFGKAFYRFRLQWFYDKNAGWASGYPDWHPKPDTEKKFNEMIKGKSIRVLKKDCLDLPPLIIERREVALSSEQNRVYKEMKRDFVAFLTSGGENDPSPIGVSIAQLAVTKALRLQQIISGFIRDEDGKDVDLGKTPRLTETKDLLEELTVNHKVIVWAAFRYNYVQLEKICQELKLNFVGLYGGMKGDDKEDAIEAFQNDPDVKVMIANRRAGGIGINLTAASYSIVYSRNFSLEEEEQSIARNHRGGSEIHEKITKIDLVAPETIDELVLEALSKKQSISKNILDLKL